MKRFFLSLIFAAVMVHAAAARSDDITLMGIISPLFFLEQSFTETITLSDQTELTVDISEIEVDSKHIYVRFFITDVPISMKSNVIDDTRLYGSYLPTAEIFTSDGNNLTPSSASRYSLLEYNSRLIIGGLIVFDTDLAPQSFYLNFNQIPFDTQPLAEGFSKAVILSPSENKNHMGTEQVSVTSKGLEFSLASTAQTNEYTMLQPSVRIERPDEMLTKFGWITFQDSSDSSRFAVTRGTLYGFNLTDDSIYSPSHAYVFSPVSTESPILITMDQVYVRRSFEKHFPSEIDLTDVSDLVLYNENEVKLTLTDVVVSEENHQIRLYISTDGLTVSDISFLFPKRTDKADPSISCGIDTRSGKFACDFYFNEIDFPQTVLDIEINAIEYKKEGPWTLTWNPVPMENIPEIRIQDAYTIPSVSRKRRQEGHSNSDRVNDVLTAIDSHSKELCTGEGWIHESFLLNYQFEGNNLHELIPVDQAELFYTWYINENWYHVNSDGQISEQVVIIRDPEDGSIVSAQQLSDKKIIDLVHALLVVTDNDLDHEYQCFDDFIKLTGSAAVFTGEYACGFDESKAICLDFYQSLNGIAGSTGSQNITFYVDPVSYLILQEKIDYDLGALTLKKTVQILEKTDIMPDDIMKMIGTIK